MNEDEIKLIRVTKKVFAPYRKYKVGDRIRAPFGVSFSVTQVRTIFDGGILTDIVHLEEETLECEFHSL
jgi:hypothetical protein